jgi:hypothetical protein
MPCVESGGNVGRLEGLAGNEGAVDPHM